MAVSRRPCETSAVLAASSTHVASVTRLAVRMAGMQGVDFSCARGWRYVIPPATSANSTLGMRHPRDEALKAPLISYTCVDRAMHRL